jgi:hypothetical protein
VAISYVQIQGAGAVDSNGILTCNITSAAGNTLITIVAANVQSTTWQVSTVQDSAGNAWTPIASVVTDNSSGPNQVLLSMWAAYNAAPVTSVTATLANQWDYVGVAALVYEVSGVTNTSPLDVSATTFTDAGTSLTLAANTTNTSDFCIAAAAIGDYANTTLTHQADSWTYSGQDWTNSGTADEDDALRLEASYKITTSAGSQSTTYTTSATIPIAGIVACFKGGPTNTANPNPNWPQLSTFAAFGSQPNGGGIPNYSTDISQYVRDSSINYGIPYELGTTEAGQNSLTLYNQDGRFDPTNTSGPYYPNVQDYVPYQMQAVWSGVSYGVATGYIERWPQEWDDTLTGTSGAIGVDAIATLARVTLKSCMQHEVLLDSPWAYWPLNDAGGSQFAANLGTGAGQGVALYPVPPRKAGAGTGDFGAQTQLAGDPATGWGQTNSTPTNDQGWCLSSGVIPASAGTVPALANGVTFEVWASFPLVPAKQNHTNIITLKSSAATWATHDVLVVTISQHGYYGTSGNVWVDTWNASGVKTSVDIGAHSYADGRWHHFAVTVNGSVVTLSIDGVSVYSGTRSITTSQVDVIEIGGAQDSWEATDIGIGTYAHVAVYPAVVGAERLASHFQSGHDGFPEDSGSRINRLLTYAGWTGQRALDTGSSVLAACSTITGQYATDAIADVTTWEYGLAWVDGWGIFRFQCRQNRFSGTSLATFGDGTGEAHYQADIAFDFDPTYQYNDVQITRQGPNNSQGITQFSGDPNGTISQYFVSTLQQTLQLLSDAQAADRASFLYNLLSIPQLRVRSITIEPSSNPALWPIALGAQIGGRYTVKRRPLGSTNALISLDVIISEIKHEIKPGSWRTTFSALPATVPGGPNILPYAVQSMESGVSGWAAGSNATIGWSTAQAYDGMHSMSLTATAAGNVTAFTATWYTIQSGQNYTFTAWVWSSVATTGGLDLDWRDSAGNYLSSASNSGLNLTANTWTALTLTATAPGGAGKVTAVVGGISATAAGQVFYVDKVTVVSTPVFTGPWRLNDTTYSVLGTTTIPAW